jgi:NADH-quinone oxidoreductase subunit K
MKNLNQAIYYFNCFFFDPFVSFDVFVFNNNISILLILANLLFFYGIYGIIINRQKFLLTMLFIEVMYVGIFAHFLISSLILNSTLGQIYAILLLIIVACESAIGLGILIVLYHKEHSINFIDFTELRG